MHRPNARPRAGLVGNSLGVQIALLLYEVKMKIVAARAVSVLMTMVEPIH